MEFLLSLVLLLILAKLFGELAERLGFPSMLGYLISGMLVGLTSLGVDGFHFGSSQTEIALFGEMGAILLLFVAGMRELDTTQFISNRKGTYISSVLGFFLPAMAIIIIAANAHLIDPRFNIGFAGAATLVACLSVSSVVTSMKVLIKMGKLNTDAGRIVLSTAVIDALFGLAVFTMISVIIPIMPIADGHFLEGIVSGLVEIFSIGVMLVVLFALGEGIVPLIVKYTAGLEVEEAQFTLAFVIMLVLAAVVSAFGLHGIIGAFLAGIIISRSSLRESNFSDKLASLSYGIFVPIFFAWIGMMVFTNFTDIENPFWLMPNWYLFLVVLIAGVFITNFLGSYIGARFGGLKRKPSALVGLGMIPRGGIGLVILAGIATSRPPFFGVVLDDFIYTSVIAVVLLSVLVSPLLISLGAKEKTI